MPFNDLQARCEEGQRQLMQTNYLDAERILASAEADAWADRDFDTLSRLYMPLQEARRQRRQTCGEGIVCLDLLAESPGDQLSGQHIVENFSHGQLLVAGWGTIEPAITLRRLQQRHALYLETFLGAVYPLDTGPVVVIVPLENDRLPDASTRTRDELIAKLPPNCLIMSPAELPAGRHKGDTITFAQVSAIWERLHAPFLSSALSEQDPLRKIQACRRTIAVDYACELAHQHASAAARQLARHR
jgi:hypothetical protein